jgi:hypothetical protein
METAEQKVFTNKQEYILYCIIICIATSLLFYPYFKWLMILWKNDPYNTFGYIIPVVSVWIIYARKKVFFLNRFIYKMGVGCFFRGACPCRILPLEQAGGFGFSSFASCPVWFNDDCVGKRTEPFTYVPYLSSDFSLSMGRYP